MEWKKIFIMPSDGHEKCDFCSSMQVFAAYSCEDFVSKIDTDWVSESKGAWAACKPCSELVDKAAWGELLERSVNAFMVKYRLPEFGRSELRSEIAKIHEGFRTHMRKMA